MPEMADVAADHNMISAAKLERKRTIERKTRAADRLLSYVGLTQDGLDRDGYIFYIDNNRIMEVKRSLPIGMLKGRGSKARIHIEPIGSYRDCQIDGALRFRSYLEEKGAKYVDLNWGEVLGKLEDKRKNLSGLIRRVRKASGGNSNA